LRNIPDNSIDCCVTSPPYYGLRNYGCDGQIGLEESPDAYITKLVDVFTEVQRILKPEGTLWLNIGDSYAGSGRGKGDVNKKGIQQKASFTGDFLKPYRLNGYKNKDLIGIPWMLAFALRAGGWYLRQDMTAVVARKLNRNYVGFELNPEYVEIAGRKLQRELGVLE